MLCLLIWNMLLRRILVVKYTVGKLTKIKTNVYNIIKNECKKIANKKRIMNLRGVKITKRFK